MSGHWLRGRGDRICIGIAFAKLEMKIIAAHLLRNYQWEILPSQNLDPFPIPTLRPKDGLKVRFRSIRQGNSSVSVSAIAPDKLEKMTVESIASSHNDRSQNRFFNPLRKINK